MLLAGGERELINLRLCKDTWMPRVVALFGCKANAFSILLLQQSSVVMIVIR